MGTGSLNGFLSDNANKILKQIKEYPQGIHTNALFRLVEDHMAKKTFTKEIVDLEDLKMISRKNAGYKKIISLSGFLDNRNKMLREQQKAKKYRIERILEASKKIDKQKRKTFVINHFIEVLATATQSFGVHIRANHVYFKSDKARAWSDLQVSNSYVKYYRLIIRTIRKLYGKESVKEFESHQLRNYMDRIFHSGDVLRTVTKSKMKKVKHK